jgi:hypothetical protein
VCARRGHRVIDHDACLGETPPPIRPAQAADPASAHSPIAAATCC